MASDALDMVYSTCPFHLAGSLLHGLSSLLNIDLGFEIFLQCAGIVPIVQSGMAAGRRIHFLGELAAPNLAP